MATLAPSAARRFAIAAPIPREPPVTTATLPANFCPLLLLICFVLFFVCFFVLRCFCGHGLHAFPPNLDLRFVVFAIEPIVSASTSVPLFGITELVDYPVKL